MTDYATILMTELAEGETSPMPVVRLAEAVHAPETTVAKIMKQLVKAGLVRSIRGASGGYCLQANPRDINLADIVEAMEGPVMLTTCAGGRERSCALKNPCSLCGVWKDMSWQIRTVMASVSLETLVAARRNHVCG